MGAAGIIFDTLAKKASEKAKEHREKADKDRESEIGIWTGVLKEPSATPEQRQKAVDNLNKLYNIKGKDNSPFAKVAAFLNHVGEKMQGKSGSGDPNAQNAAPEAQPSAVSSVKDAAAKSLPPLDGGGLNPAQKNIGEKMLGKVTKGLGAGLSALSHLTQPEDLKNLPPLDASAFPTGEQQRALKVAYITAETKAREEAEEPYIEKRYKMQAEARGDKTIRSWTGDDNKMHILVRKPDGEEVEEIHGNVRPQASTLPTTSTTTTTPNAETGGTTTTRTTKKGLPALNEKSKNQTQVPSAKAPQDDKGKGSSAIAALAQDWHENGNKPPAKYQAQVSKYMRDNHMTQSLPKPVTERNAEAAIKDVMPLLTDLEGLLEAKKGQNGLMDTIAQRARFMKYNTLGQHPDDPTDAAILQLTAFAQIAGAAPWIRVGRGKYLYGQIIQHLPDPSKDTYGNMYDKVKRLKGIFEQEMASQNSSSVDDEIIGLTKPRGR